MLCFRPRVTLTRSLGVHTSLFAIVRAVGPATALAHSVDDDTPRGQVARPILRAAFAFLAAFAHKHPENQSAVWRGVGDVIERCVGAGVNAEVALAEVTLGNEAVADSFSGSLINTLAAAFNRSTANAHAVIALQRCAVVSAPFLCLGLTCCDVN